MNDEIDRQLGITEDLTEEHKGTRKTAIELEIGELDIRISLSDYINILRI